MSKLSEDVRAEMRLFAYYLANRTLDLSVLEGHEYGDLFEDPSALEQAVAIWSNVVEMNESGRVRNAGLANHRVAQFVRSRVDHRYVVEPAFAEWELELHGP
jgi:hypothetical protein